MPEPSRQRRRERRLTVKLASVAAMALLTGLAGPPNPLAAGQNLAPFIPTPEDVVDRMLTLAKVTQDDVVYDLGCGDGRIPIAAAKKYGAKGIGLDLDPSLVELAKSNA